MGSRSERPRPMWTGSIRVIATGNKYKFVVIISGNFDDSLDRPHVYKDPRIYNMSQRWENWLTEARPQV